MAIASTAKYLLKRFPGKQMRSAVSFI